jgi:hypothetical protein
MDLSFLVAEACVDWQRDASDVARIVDTSHRTALETSMASTMSTGRALAMACPTLGSARRNCCITSLTIMGVFTPVGCTELTQMR